MQQNKTSIFGHLTAWAFAACLVPAVAMAAPYSISYTGTIANSAFAEVNDGQAYTATLVVDNGGNSALNQTWNASNLQCVILKMNNAQNVQFAHDLSNETLTTAGSISTNGSGVLTGNFSEVSDSFASGGVTPGSYTTSGFALPDTIHWFLNDANDIFYDGNGTAFGDAAGGTLMGFGNWSNPQPFTGTCSVQTTAPASIPTISQWGMMMLSSLLMLAAIFALRRQRQ